MFAYGPSLEFRVSPETALEAWLGDRRRKDMDLKLVPQCDARSFLTTWPSFITNVRKGATRGVR